MSRPDWDTYFVNLLPGIAARGTCARTKMGCVMVNERMQIVSTGYNGPAAGRPHCVDSPCQGASFDNGLGLEHCEAIHAESNALLQCRDVYSIHTAYVTKAPCIHCLKLLLNTSCQRIVFLKHYHHPESERLWRSAGREWVLYEKP